MSTVPQSTPRQKASFFIQNLFTLLLMAVFIRTSPKEEEREFAGDEIDALTDKLLTNKALLERVQAAGHFDVTEAGVELTAAGRALTMHKSRSLQSDAYNLHARAYFNGSTRPGVIQRPFMNQIHILGHILDEFATQALNIQNSEEGLTAEETNEIILAWNASNDRMTTLLSNLKVEEPTETVTIEVIDDTVVTEASDNVETNDEEE